MVLPARLKYINKAFTNRIMRLIAGKKRSPIALIQHRGRRSGKYYSTPILIAPAQRGFIFALTYGTNVDWYKNILADRRALLVWNGNSYLLHNPLPLPEETGRQAFGGLSRHLLGWLKIRDYFGMST